MSKVKLAVAAVLAMTLIGGLTVGAKSVSAASTTVAKCKLSVPTKVHGLGDFGSNITVSGHTATATVIAQGDYNCKNDITLASWQLPNKSGLPLKSQKLFASTTKHIGVGENKISVQIPDCYWQVDLLQGTRATAADGTASYVWGKDLLMDFKLGGNKSCTVTPPVTPTPTPTPVTPVTPVTPETPETPAEAPVTAVPDAGASSIVAGTVGLSATVGLAYNLIQRRKLLR